jgi:hypothetical protein
VATLPLHRLLCKSLRAGGETRLPLRMLLGKSVCARGEMRLCSCRLQAGFALARKYRVLVSVVECAECAEFW